MKRVNKSEPSNPDLGSRLRPERRWPGVAILGVRRCYAYSVIRP
jgi:hypothetical protein